MKRSKHDLSHYRLTTLNQGFIYPVMCQEVLPGDGFRHQVSCLLRVSPLVSPVMHPVHVNVHSWYVPCRLLWDSWEDFITGTDTAATVPTIDTNASLASGLLGISLGAGLGATSRTLNALPFRAYNKIYNEFYRDQDLNTPLTEAVGDTDLAANYSLVRGSWRKDYFTTARPYPQQGQDTQVVSLDLNLGTAPVKGLGVPDNASADATDISVFQTGDPNAVVYAQKYAVSPNFAIIRATQPGASGRPDVVADLSALTGAASMDINAWRQAMAMQRIREHRNRFGQRYTDLLRFLGVTPSDARLDRPEYLGGGKQTVAFSEVLSTADTENAVVGDLAGHGIAALRTRPYRRFFEEHGYVLTFLLVRPITVYNDAIPRHFLRSVYSDYWQKELEMLGEQPISNAEIYGNTSTPAGVFGYIPRYDEYRHAQSFVSGEFRTTLDYWHMARKFSSQPVLNGSFVQCDPTDRIYADTSTDELQTMVAHRIMARRLVSKQARA